MLSRKWASRICWCRSDNTAAMRRSFHHKDRKIFKSSDLFNKVCFDRELYRFKIYSKFLNCNTQNKNEYRILFWQHNRYIMQSMLKLTSITWFANVILFMSDNQGILAVRAFWWILGKRRNCYKRFLWSMMWRPPISAGLYLSLTRTTADFKRYPVYRRLQNLRCMLFIDYWISDHRFYPLIHIRASGLSWIQIHVRSWTPWLS